MKIISCTGYYGTGSSAVTDFFSEFDNVLSLTNYEFRFAHDPDGLSDLEYNLIENHNRHNSGHALKRYKQLVDYYGNHFLVQRYEPFFQNQWKQISYQYIDSLVDFKYHGYWQYDFLDRGPFFEFWKKLPQRILKKTIWKNQPDKDINLLPKEITYCSAPSEEFFLKQTRAYTTALFEAANYENCEYLTVDQVVPSSNIERYLRYFDNLKVVVVDRDPRDIYLLSKYNWKDSIVPKDSIELFCKWFIYVRLHSKTALPDNKRVMFVKFEDFIYDYEKTTNKIMEWMGIDNKHHVFPYKFLNPQLSIKNTRVWEKNAIYEDEANQIARLLPQYLYD